MACSTYGILSPMTRKASEASDRVSRGYTVETEPARVTARLFRGVRWGIVAVLLLSAAAAAVVYALGTQTEATYEAVARFAIVPSNALQDATATDLVASIAALDRPIVNATVSELLQSGVVAETAAGSMGLPAGALSLYEIEAAEVPGSAIVRVSVTGPDAATAAGLAQAIRVSAPTTLQGFLTVFDVQPVDRSTVGAQRTGPNPERDAIAVGTAVALLGIAVVLLIATRRDVSRTRASDYRSESELRDRGT